MGDWIAAIIAAALISYGYTRLQARRRERFIEAYAFPPSIETKLRARYPHLDTSQTAQIIDGLRDYFAICNRAGRRMVSMPSQAVDVAWHEFILFTRNYQSFCKQGIGRFLHHVPAEAMATPTLAQDGIKRAWRLACQREGLNPKNTPQLPRLFRLDTDLNIPDGFKYLPNCQGADGRSYYCAGHIGCGGGCGGSSGGCSGSSSGSGDSSGCSSGCGGD